MKRYNFSYMGSMIRYAITFLGIMLPFLSVATVTASPAPHITFAVTPAQPLMDDQINITISGLPPNRLITLRAKSRAQDQLWWRSEALFNSGPDGAIDLHVQTPISGTYQGVDGMGLFWSMKPDVEPKSADHAFFAVMDWFTPIVTEIDVEDPDRVLGSVTIERRFAKPGIHSTEIAGDGIAGVLYDPGDGQRHPGVIVLGGSEGGLGGRDVALLLADHGFTTISLAYFGMKGLPPTLQKIPIEYFGKVVQWMRARPEVDPNFFAVFGASRGAEAALLMAATFPDIKAVIARSPSHVCWEGVTAKHRPGGPAWTFDGKPLPYVPNQIPFGFVIQYVWSSLAGNPVRQTPLFLQDLAVFGSTASAEIPVERIQGPVLLLSGTDDQIWPSSLMATRIIERLQRNRHAYKDEHLSYDGAGHWIPSAYVPTRGSRKEMKLAIGGTPEATAVAQADSWPKILLFLMNASAK